MTDPAVVVEERPYTKLYRDIWDDRDFTALSPDAKLVYLALISNKKITTCGVIDYLPGRLANATGLDAPMVEAAVTHLEGQRYVFVDRHEGEIAVRTYVKNEVQIRNSKRCSAVWSAWRKVQSAAIRARLAISFPPELFAAAVSNVPSEAAVLVDNYRNGIEPDWSGLEPDCSGSTVSSDLDLHLDLEQIQQHQPVQQQGISTELAAAPHPSREDVMAAAVELVLVRRDKPAEAARTANDVARWLNGARNGIRIELVDADAWTEIAAGATPEILADLITERTPADPVHQTVPASSSTIVLATQTHPPTCTTCHRDPRDHDDHCPECNPDAPLPQDAT